MSTPNLFIELQAILAVSNQLSQIPPYIVNFDFGNPTQSATQSFFDPFFQAANPGPTTVNLPASPAFTVLIQNISQTGQVLIVNATPAGGSSQAYRIGQGGVWMYFDPLETGTGITALTLAGAASTTPAMVFVGG